MTENPQDSCTQSPQKAGTPNIDVLDVGGDRTTPPQHFWDTDKIRSKTERIKMGVEELDQIEQARFLKIGVHFFPEIRSEDLWHKFAGLREQDMEKWSQIEGEVVQLPDLLTWPGMAPDNRPKMAMAAAPSPAWSQKKRRHLQTIREAKEIVTISILWNHFGLPGCASRSCHSPFRTERRPSFSVYQTRSGEERFKDHGDPEVRGDSFDFYQLCTGLDKKEAYKPFLDLAERVHREGTRPAQVRGKEVPVGPKPLPADFRERAKVMSLALKNHSSLCARVSNVRNWKVDTLEKLATEGCLGWHLQSLAFIYSTGIKLRNWFDDADRKVWWLMGGTSIWRADKMVEARKVYVCEGETDCISLVDAGVETNPTVAVVAVPSASTFHPSWAPLFADKDVTLCMDGDPAGQTAQQRIGALIHPYAAVLKTFNPGEVQ